MTYQTHDTCPTYTQAEWRDGRLVAAVGPRWSGKKPPPAIGTEIGIGFNDLGRATVTGYFTEGGWLGVICRLHDAPDWHKRQCKGDPTAHVFGSEVVD